MSERYYANILDTIYPSYSWGERSKLDIFGNGYAGKDPLQPYDAAKLLKYVMSSVFAYDKDEIAEFEALDVDSAILHYYDESLVEELAQNFNSPGKFTLIAKSRLLAILVGAGLLVATADHAGVFATQRTAVSAQVGSAMSGHGEAAAKAELNNYLNSLTGTTWKPVQTHLGRSAKNTLGLSLDNSVEVARHKAELSAQ